MNSIEFCKLHGFGNDYIIFENESLGEVADFGAFAAKVCNRYTGIGGDGIAVLEKIDDTNADYDCRIINPDGSEAGFSGNGTRCAVAYLYLKKLWSDKDLRLRTKSGEKIYEFLRREENTFWFRAELGKPDFKIPESDFSRSVKDAAKDNKDAEFSKLMFPGLNLVLDFFFVDVGNPVTCFFVEDFEKFDWRTVGKKVESLVDIFPQKTNVVFIKKINADNIEIRIWERGAGETSSSGTCSIAAAVAFLNGENRRGNVAVHAVGGTTEAVWRADDEMQITGRADLAFCGEVFYGN